MLYLQIMLLHLVAGISSTACSSGPAPVQVLFSQAHEQVLSPFDRSFDGISDATAALRARGVAVRQSWDPLPVALEQLSCAGSSGRVLVLSLAMQRSYSPEDVEAVKRFVANGGGVLVLSEADNVFMSSDFQNAMLAPYGIKVLPARLSAAKHYNNITDVAES